MTKQEAYQQLQKLKKEPSPFKQFVEMVVSQYPAMEMPLVVELCEIAKPLAKINDANGMRCLTEKELQKKIDFRERVEVIVRKNMPKTEVQFNSDWRAAAIKLKFPNGRFNCIDQTWGVPVKPSNAQKFL